MKIFSKDSIDEFLVALADEQICRLQHFKITPDGLSQLNAGEFKFADHEELGDKFVGWCKSASLKNCECRWILSRNLYQTYQVDPPNVLPKEMDEAIKWQVKDLLEYNIDQAMVTHYQPTVSANEQVTAVASQKQLVETIIEATHQTGLPLSSIDIEELSLGHALNDQIDENQVTGFIGEDAGGLVFNFYQGGGLAFTRHKKGKFLPNSEQNEFSLEADQEAEQESFLLEMQRTLDYVVSQIFRRPIDKILLQENNTETAKLAELIRQITEIEVSLVTPLVNRENDQLTKPMLAEVGAAMRGQ